MKLTFTQAALLVILLTGVAARLPANASDTVFRSIALTGWNTDVVFENTSSPVATSFDLLNQRQSDSPHYAWFESGLEGHTDGLPASRRIVSPADTNVLFDLQSYTNNNVLLLSAAKPSGTLALVEPSAYRALVILAAAGGGDASLTVQIHFSDGTNSKPIVTEVPDWFTGSETKPTRTPAITGLGRSNGRQGFGYEEHGDDGFGLYQSKIDLTAVGLDQKAIQSIGFKKGSGSGTAGVFAISGAPSKSADSPKVQSERK